MAKTLPKEGTSEWQRLQTAKKTAMMNPEQAKTFADMSVDEANKIVAEYGIKMDRGGTVVGESHSNGGVPFELQDTGTHIEEEGNEINIPRELAESDKIYEFEGTNWEILNKILKLGGLSLKNEVTDVKSGDIVICIKSAWDDVPRKYKGTIRQVLSAINESRGCNHIESGATMKNLKTGEEKKMRKGGDIGAVSCKTCKWWNEGRATKNIIAECDFGNTITGGKFEKTKKAFYVTVSVEDDSNLHYELMTGEDFGCVHHTEKGDKKSKGGLSDSEKIYVVFVEDTDYEGHTSVMGLVKDLDTFKKWVEEKYSNWSKSAPVHDEYGRGSLHFEMSDDSDGWRRDYNAVAQLHTFISVRDDVPMKDYYVVWQQHDEDGNPSQKRKESFEAESPKGAWEQAFAEGDHSSDYLISIDGVTADELGFGKRMGGGGAVKNSGINWLITGYSI